MSNSTPFIAAVVGGIAGAIIGSLVTMALSTEPPDLRGPTAGELEAAFRRALADEVGPLREELARSRQDDGRAARKSEEPTATGAVEPTASGRRRIALPARTPTLPALRSTDGGLTPEASLLDLRLLRGFEEEENAHVHRRWMFTSEHDALATFGTPSFVWAREGGGETWHYELETGNVDEDGDPISEEYELSFLRGRLIRVNHD